MFLRGCLDERLLLCFYGALLTSVHFHQGQETVDFPANQDERRQTGAAQGTRSRHRSTGGLGRDLTGR